MIAIRCLAQLYFNVYITAIVRQKNENLKRILVIVKAIRDESYKLKATNVYRDLKKK